jgi:cytochrome c553
MVVAPRPLAGTRHEQTRDAPPKYVVEHWEREFAALEAEIKQKGELYARGKDPYENQRILDQQSCILPGDRTPFDVEYRRTEALVDCLQNKLGVSSSDARRRLSLLGKRVKGRIESEGPPTRPQALSDYVAIAALRRSVALSNPLLDFDRLLFVGRGNYYGDDPTGQHQLSGPLAFCNRVGGGLYVVKDFKTNAQVIDLLENSVVKNGAYRGWRPSGKGSFYSPELSYDGRTILFAWSENRIARERAGWGLGKAGPIHRWPPENAWHIFKVNADGTELAQLTEGPWNDFDPCFLPSGRIAFVSERRGGYIRCFRQTLFMEPTTYVMHTMNGDGSDVAPLSYFEASEWAPSVDNHGMLVYSRWDYVDRENGLGSTFWTCFPDGRNPRSPHGNYPHPYSVQPEYGGPKKGTRPLGPCSEVHFRAVPGSPRYVFAGVPHHGASFGPLALLDPRIPDQGTMNQVTRITADQQFPESQTQEGIETDDRVLKYGTPWPLSEDFYLCNYHQSLILLDRFGTKTVLCTHRQCPGMGDTMRPVEPIPLRPRKKPPEVPVSTFAGERAAVPHAPAVIGVINIHVSDLPFPKDRPARWLRIVQLFPKTTPYRDMPNMGHGQEGIPRMSLGVVPVEADGSVYCKAPVGKLLVFQALDENMMAIQSMRSVAYVHPGERLTCIGCHEHQWKAPSIAGPPMAFQRRPSELIKEPSSQEPITYYRTVKPIFDGKCVPCHKAEGQGPQDMDYNALKGLSFYFSGAHMNNYSNPQVPGMGTRSVPGLVGAHYSRMGLALLKNHRAARITEEEYRRVCLWLDLNSPRLGAFNDVAKQEQGQLVWPDLDVDPANVTGVESAGDGPHRGRD